MPGPAGWAQGEHAHGGPQLPRADQYGLKQGRIDFAPLRKKLGKELPVDVTHEMLLTYVEKRRGEGAAAATIRYEIVVLARMYNLAIHAGLQGRWKAACDVRVR